MAITDLTGCTWEYNATSSTFGPLPIQISYDVSGTLILPNANITNFSQVYANEVGTIFAIGTVGFSSGGKIYGVALSTGLYVVTFTGGTHVTNATLIAWLEANGTLTAPASNLVEVTYNNSTILSTSSTGTYTLPTANKYMSTDIVITANDLTGLTLSSTYNGNTILSTSTTGTYTLSTAGKYMATNVVITLAEATPSGYSGNITSESQYGAAVITHIKFGSAPTSASDYDSVVSLTGTITGATSYTNQTKAYIWGFGGVRINSVETWCNDGSYSNAIEITLTGNYDIIMFYGPPMSGGSGL